MTHQFPETLRVVLEYHARSKHWPERYARSAGFLDWANQPDPFRHFDGATRIGMEIPVDQSGPAYDSLFGQLPQPAEFDLESVSQLFFYGMSISAWKKVPGGEAWPLRVNPSSGNLHPTESWLICGPDPQGQLGGVFHYAVDRHGLEQRLCFDSSQWRQLVGEQADSGFLLGLSSVCWREAWKYGERAYRYVNHDVGHALGALAVSAAGLGWSIRLLEIGAGPISGLLGLGGEADAERERADCLVWVSLGLPPDEGACGQLARSIEDAVGEMNLTGHTGTPNRLSKEHRDWPVLDQIAEACEESTLLEGHRAQCLPSSAFGGMSPWIATPRETGVRNLVRQRRSAVAMDGETRMTAGNFLHMLWRVMPGDTCAWSVGLVAPCVSLVLFIHRVDGLEPGVYLLVRDAAHLSELQRLMRPEFEWEQPELAQSLPLYRLITGDCRQAARIISCHQDIASDGVFSCGMLTRFRDTLESAGPSGYPRLFWETGLIGQLLYLEAEAGGVRATGIGCFFDDLVHELLGIDDDRWQSLYHFTVGGPVEDTRLQTLPAYRSQPDANV